MFESVDHKCVRQAGAGLTNSLRSMLLSVATWISLDSVIDVMVCMINVESGSGSSTLFSLIMTSMLTLHCDSFLRSDDPNRNFGVPTNCT